MDKFVFLLKTYEKDFAYAERLLNSFAKYNEDNIHCYIVVPKDSRILLENLFDEEVKRNLSFVAEEEFEGLGSESINGISAGYINQEIIKLSFWEKGFCENYCCIDSDAEFIRKFYYYDFMYDDHTPYSVLVEDKDLKADPVYYETFWTEREKALLRIRDEMEIKTSKLMTCHGFQNFSSKVLKNFKENFMVVKGYDYVDLMKISPYEFTWYNLWLQKSKVIDIHPCEPFFKTFHMKQHLLYSKMQGVSLDDLARSYVGIIINSNYTKGKSLSYNKRVANIWEIIKLVISLFKISILYIK